MKYKIPITIIIACSDDIRIKKCLESIDEKVETIVVLNKPSSEVIKIVKSYKVKIKFLNEKNLPKSLNLGIKNSKNNIVLFMDSDCVFEKGAIKKIYKAMNKFYITKGKTVFESNGFLSRLVANVRDYTYYDDPKPYNPFLAINKKIKKFINNYYYDDDIHWTEDADLYVRIKKAKLKVNYEYNARVFHPPLNPFYDLRSAFRYGIGKRIRVEKKLITGIGTQFNFILDVILKKGFFTGFYYFIWNIFYLFGYINQIFFDPYKFRSKVNLNKNK